MKLIDSSPELETVIRRVRGGFLKIQGTWLPFETAERLAARTCYHIRYALIPLFGPGFPDKCLQPHEPGFGQLQLHEGETSPRRRKRSAPSRSLGDASPEDPLFKRRRSDHGAVMAGGPAGAGTPGSHRYSRSVGSAAAAGGGPGAGRPPLAPLDWHESRRYSTAATSSDDESDGSPRYLTLPPPMPQKLDIPDHDWLLNSPDDFVQVLQASRSLQQMSAGPRGRRWSHDHSSLGGGFEAGGKLWQWDGDRELLVVGTTASSSPQTPSSGAFRPIAPSPHDRRRTNSVPEAVVSRYDTLRRGPAPVPAPMPSALAGTGPAAVPRTTAATNANVAPPAPPLLPGSAAHRRSMDIQNILT